ncbi:Intraflagellar transport complex B protein 46 [Spironucleus salmonicida]|uniref:Intraflagellar transport complex B protein 46 n=1 Tax=Spironucleus salmonicida TaxID=348837 RepID=V6LGC9_9EUKA|nr:Intraflagellar transport complex B protein 46 [Spironucleus salmonicida]|eukprot:EST43582.1 Intraflagellar transport complex B protein 46 [Spironucleus salmonicida]
MADNHEDDTLTDEPSDNFATLTNDRLLELFRTFVPTELMLETLFVPFLPDYQPAIGDVDPFIKVGRPDGKLEPLGLIVLDEPCNNQSEPTILESMLEAKTKPIARSKDKTTIKSNKKDKKSQDAKIKAIDYDKEIIHDWVDKVEKIHQTQGSAEYNYSVPVPSATILELWDTEMESIIKTIDLPKPSIELSIEQYAKVCCLILDIPVGPNAIESLHMFFTNYRDVLDETEVIKQQQGYQ